MDMARKAVVELAIEGTNCWRTPPTVGVEPELEADYLKRMKIQVGEYVRPHERPHTHCTANPFLTAKKRGKRGVPETTN